MQNLIQKLQLITSRQGLIIASKYNIDLSEFAKQGLKFDLTACQTRAYAFVIVFLTTRSEIESFAQKFLENKNSVIDEQTVIWLCYPKISSKQYKCEFNRDTGWKELESKFDLLPVRQIAFDGDWSALRFKFRSQIAKITRKF